MSRTPLEKHLEEGPERLGFKRDLFPLEYNGHFLYVLHNDAYIEEKRLQVHLTLYCDKCSTEFTLRGHGDPSTEWTPRHLQDVKVLVLGPFVEDSCPIKGSGGRIGRGTVPKL